MVHVAASAWSLQDISALVAVIAVVVAAVTTMWREPRLRPWRLAAYLSGAPERRYARNFNRRWGQYENGYLHKPENSDFHRTYIPVSLERVGSWARPPAAEVLGTRTLRAITVIGEPGSGKSTLMRAYGIEVLRRHREMPFLVQLRRFAVAHDRRQVSLADHVIRDVLPNLEMSQADAARLFDRALRRDRAVLLLDGLDEVPQEHQDEVLQAVYEFRERLDEDRPTGRARVILTCRQANFTALRDKWEPVMRMNVHPGGTREDSFQVATIAPLTDAEISRYLHAVRSEFQDSQSGPRTFLHAVRASGTLDLHRVPLVLSMSVGLYADKSAFDIPSEKAQLYQKMVSEMLVRHAFKEPTSSWLRYLERDKRRFLRMFATANATGAEGCGEPFGDFPRYALDRFAIAIVEELNSVTGSEAPAFVNEIIDHSGLLARGNDEDTFIFAHKSIQEHLVAEHLRTLGESGAELLLARSDQTQWRQVFAFYVGTDDQSTAAADSFLTRLAERDLALAGSCVAAAPCSNEVADRILHQLADRIVADERIIRAGRSTAGGAASGSDGDPDGPGDGWNGPDEGWNGPGGAVPAAGPGAATTARPDQRATALVGSDQQTTTLAGSDQRAAAEQRILVNLAALLDTTQSVRQHVAGLAGELVPRILEKIITLGAVFELLGTDLDSVARVVDALARTGNPAHIASMAPKVSDAAPTDARLVGPLWRCLAVPGMETQPGTERIVERLLTMVMDPVCLRELQAQEQTVPDFATAELRHTVYPFHNGLPPESNLVTLLCWADRLDTEPALPNRFFEARRQDRQRFARAEADHRRTPRVSLWRAGRALSGLGLVAACLLCFCWLITDPGVFGRAAGWASLAWYALPALVSGLAFATVATWARRRAPTAPAHRYLTAGAAPGSGRSGHAVAEVLAKRLPAPAAQLTFLASTVVYGPALAPLLDSAPVVFLAALLATQWLLGWAPMLAVFDRGEQFYLYRPNPYDDMYDDERSRHWISPDVD